MSLDEDEIFYTCDDPSYVNIRRMCRIIRKMTERVKENPEDARIFLYNAGILDENGNICAEFYE